VSAIHSSSLDELRLDSQCFVTIRPLASGLHFAKTAQLENPMLIKRAVSVVALLLFFYSGRCTVQAQTDERGFDVNAVYSTINLGPFNTTESGAGVRLSYTINKYLAVEAEGNLFEFAIGDHPTDEFLGAQGLIGIKTGLRHRWIGVFAKLRPGVANFPKLRVRQRQICFPIQSCGESGKGGNRLAVDAGAVVELYPTEKIILRLDLGDTMIRFNQDAFFRSTSMVRINDGFSHNLQFGGSVGFRF
jgi:hypothetical protein